MTLGQTNWAPVDSGYFAAVEEAAAERQRLQEIADQGTLTMEQALLQMPECIPRALQQEIVSVCSVQEDQTVRGYNGLGRGLRGVAALGQLTVEQYRRAYASYLVDHRKWEEERAIYEQAVAQHSSWSQLTYNYRMAYGAWQAAHAQWEQAMATYTACGTEWDAYLQERNDVQRVRDEISAYYESIRQAVEQRWGVRPRESCINAQFRAQMQSLCQSTQYHAQVVAGLGGQVTIGGITYGTDTDGVPYCAKAELPLCQAMPQYPESPMSCGPSPGAEPQPPSRPGNEPSVPVLRNEPQPPAPPAGVTMPPCIPAALKQEATVECQEGSMNGLIGLGQLPEPYASAPCAAAQLPTCEELEEEEKARRQSVMVGGILLLVALGGGYAVYRAVKKKGRR